MGCCALVGLTCACEGDRGSPLPPSYCVQLVKPSKTKLPELHGSHQICFCICFLGLPGAENDLNVGGYDVPGAGPSAPALCVGSQDVIIE